MSITKKKPKARPARQRRSPEEVRRRALESARSLLAANGPTAITLKAVADDLGMTHTNLIHHFGSAGELQSALMREMVRELTLTIEGAMARSSAGEVNRRQFVDLVFDAFDQGGAGRLAAWIVMSGNARLLAPVGQVVREYVTNVEQTIALHSRDPKLHERVTSSLLLVTLAALGDAIIGDTLRKMVERDRDALREIITNLLYTIHGEASKP
ncbi:MAG: TetR/AcrR family transcriptional regulator [Candidatus Obscuribacterales bacterium]|nr:TetR/AcrR family transcriptional regulator [Steroidobacteraceae bacterium]